MENTHNSFLENRYFIWTAVGAILAVYFFTVIVYTSEFPFVDDYVTTLEFLNRYYEANTGWGKIQAILAQWSEHRIGVGKSITLLYQKAFGPVSFVVLSVLSNFSLVAFYAILLLQVKKEARLYLILPLALLFFQLQYYIAQQWLVTSSSFFYMLLFSILSLHFFRKNQMLYALLLGAIAIFCNANGFLILLGEAVLLFLHKDLKRGSLFLAILGACMGVYFIGYVPHENDKLLTFYYLKNPWPTIHYTWMFVGAPLNLFSEAATVMGALACGYFGWLTYKRYYERNPVVYLLLFTLLATAVLAALGRSFWSVQQALESRYKIFSTIIWLCVLISLVEEYVPRAIRVWYPLLLTGCICFCVGSYLTSWKFMVRFRERKEAQFTDIYTDKPIKVMSDAREILLLSIQKNYYKAPKGALLRH